MINKTSLAAALAVAGLAVPAIAQDSVSQNPGTQVGDALVPWDAASQRTDFVVDLTPFTTSGGAQFGIAPILKSSKTSEAFFSSIISAQTVSATEVVVEQFAAGEYLFWDTPGPGVNTATDANSDGQPVTPDAEGEIRQFVAGFTEFSTTDAGASHGAAITGLVQFDKTNPSRLYVSRIIGATSGADNTQNNGGINTGTADAAGFYYFRSDNFGASGPSPIAGNNIFRIDLLGRDTSIVNSISAAGGADATASERVVNASPDTYSVPGNIPADVAGRPIYAGLNFNGEYAGETSPGVVTTTSAHLASDNQRGTIATYKGDLLNNSGIASGAHIAREASGATTGITVYSVDGSGAVIPGSATNFIRPSGPILDRFENFNVADVANGSTGTVGEFDHYHSQVPFNGGNGTVALGRDGQGNSLIAGVTYITGSGNQDPFNAIVVGRFDPTDPDGTIEWGIGAYIDLDNAGPNGVSGKPVYDDMGNEIGQLRPFPEINGTPGIGVSGPAFDAAGNIWFTGLVGFPDGKGGQFLNTTLLRGVYQPDVNGGFGYRLEKVVSFFDEFESQNTGLNYRVFGFVLNDGNSVNSGTFWSSNVKQCAWGGMDPSDLDPADPRSTAGVVVSTSITYDVDQDGDFNFQGVADPTSEDEAYNVLLYIAPNEKVVNDCTGDLDGSGNVDAADLAILIAAWGQTASPANLDGMGTVDAADLAILIAAWGPCP